MKTRSHAIRQAVLRYNDAAKKLTPPRESLQWDKVVEYAFLSEFDILADTREDVRKHPWAQPAARALTDQFYKLERAKEEILRLDTEIPRLITFMQDEEDFLQSMELLLQEKNPTISYQISLRCRRFELINQEHLHRLHKLSMNVKFTGSLSPGVAKEHIAGDFKSVVKRREGDRHLVQRELEDDAAEALEEEEEEAQEIELGDDIEMVMRMVEGDKGTDLGEAAEDGYEGENFS